MPPFFQSKNAIFSKFQGKPINHSCIVKPLIDLCYQGKLKEAIDSLILIARKGIRLDSRTLTFVIANCAKARALREGKFVHLHLKATGMKHPNVLLSNHLIHMYFECGDHIEARKVFDRMSVRNLYSWNNALSGYAKLGMMDVARSLFDKMSERDVVSWNSMVIGYAQVGEYGEALRFYREFRKESVECNAFSYAGVLTVGLKLKDMGLIRQGHCQVLVAGFLSNVVLCSSILDAYGRCEEMGDARKLFDEMPVRDIPAWTALISGYCRCGDMKSAKELFGVMPEKNPVSWTAMVSGYARNNDGYASLNLFRKMMFFRIRPDQFTFSSALCASASRASLKHDEGIAFFKSMIDHGVSPDEEHYACLVDLLGRAGCFDELMKQLETMPCKGDDIIWNALVGVCRIHENVELGKQAAENLIKMDPQSYAPYLLLSSIHAACGDWKGVELMRDLMNHRCARKEQASSWG